ncbi:MAG: STAS domain-containing protein [Ornithinimicrobium sp.]
MQFSTSTDGGTTVIQCEGRLNMVAAPRLRALLEETVGAGQSRVVLDLARTAFVDSSGLGAMIAGLKTARQAGGDLRIAAAVDQVQTVLGLTNLDRVLRPYASVSEANSGW